MRFFSFTPGSLILLSVCFIILLESRLVSTESTDPETNSVFNFTVPLPDIDKGSVSDEILCDKLKSAVQEIRNKHKIAKVDGENQQQHQKRETIAEIAELVLPEDGQSDQAPSLEITYRVTQSSKKTPREVIDKTLRKAFDKWEEKADVAFVPKEDGVADLDLRFEDGEHDDHEAFDGAGGIAAHAFKTKGAASDKSSIGGIHFDDGDDWTEESLLRVSSFEIGKLLQMIQEKGGEIEEINTDEQNPQQYGIDAQYPNEYNGGYYGGGMDGWGPPGPVLPPVVYNNYYGGVPGPYYGAPGFGLGPLAYPQTYIGLDTFRWSNYGASANYGLDPYSVSRIQGIYGSPNQRWLERRHRHRERSGNQHSNSPASNLRQSLQGSRPTTTGTGFHHGNSAPITHNGNGNGGYFHNQFHPQLNPYHGFGALRGGGHGFSGGHGAMPGFGGRPGHAGVGRPGFGGGFGRPGFGGGFGRRG